ncbi:hypothetical protein SRB5_22810 [Streptomyces sp. RB5]|uniref:HTH luxR-type domain-containing protein n=1 Tax=Streptomyces smaragdinus TaxID=2585196 RepID=A0A7K0CFA3_9ACTN|nr:AAA family ATPase [Streptomyces smaragdinus]MQY12151.1 hypothetical protein [Streptomyces smaragdinus]
MGGSTPTPTARDILGDAQAMVVSPVFVGRTHEMKTLDSALARAAAGEPQALIVGGEAGVGKSRLLEEFLRTARTAGAVTAVGGCLELGADGLPFAPLVTALRRLQRELGSDALAAAAAGREAELARLLPDLAPAPSPADAEGRARLYEVTARLLERLAAGRTVVLALEDLHWADGSTRDLVGYLFRTLQDTRLLLLLTYRSDDVHRRHPLRPFLAEADRSRTVRRIELPRLTEEETAGQIAGIRGRPDADLARRIHARAEGNPFFVEELATGSGGCIGDSLRDLLLVRVERLPDRAQQVVRIAAEGESRMEYGLLAAVCGLSEDDLLDALRAAVAGQVLVPVEDDRAGGSYRFRHSLLQEAVCDDHLPGECARLHRRFAEALAADPGLVGREEQLTRLAWHWYYGREPAKALPAVLDASAQARRRYAYAEQYALLHRALELWDEVPAEVRAGVRPFDAAENYPAGSAAGAVAGADLLAEVVVAARYAGEFERALTVARRALRQLGEEYPGLLEDAGGAVPDGVRERAAWFWLQRERLAQDLGRGDGHEELSRARRLVADLAPCTVRAEVLTADACRMMLTEAGPAALRAAERARTLAARTGPEAVELGARVTRAVLLCETGETERGITELTLARERARIGGYHHAAVRAEINLSAELAALGRSAEAVEIAVTGAHTAAAQGRRDYQVFCLVNQIEALIPLGRWDEAAAVVERAAQIRTAGVEPRAGIGFHGVRLALWRGRTEGMRERIDAIADDLGPLARRPSAALAFASVRIELATALGDFTAARGEAERVLDIGWTPGTHVLAWPLLHLAAAAESAGRGLTALDEGRPEFLRRLRATAAGLPRAAPVWAAYALLVEAEADRAEGVLRPGPWQRAAALFESLDRPYQLALARLRRAEALLGTSGRPSADARARARELLADVHETAARLRAVRLREEADQLASRTRVPFTRIPPPPAPDDPLSPFGLTARERDVLRLVSLGRTNRQIAGELFISPKTASVHVSNLMAKLGVSGRGEAAALSHRLGVF